MPARLDRPRFSSWRFRAVARLFALGIAVLGALVAAGVALGDDTTPDCLMVPPGGDKYFCAIVRHMFTGRAITRLGWQGSMGNTPEGDYWKLIKIEIWHRDAMGNPERVSPSCCGEEMLSHSNPNWPNPGFTYAYDNLAIESSGVEVEAYYCGVFWKNRHWDFSLNMWVEREDQQLKWTAKMATNTASTDYSRPSC